MGLFINLESATDERPLWLDSTAYTARLLEGGQAPWLEIANFLSWQRKAQGLLRSDVIALQAEPVVDALLARQPELRSAMAAKSRALFPLKTLLAATQLREQLVEMLSGLRACFPGVPLAFVVPSPRRWIVLSYRQAFGADADVEAGADEFDSASVYVADFLRSFSEAGLDILLLDEAADTEPASPEEIEWYRPVLNVATHYRWELGLRLPLATVDPGMVEGIGFFVAPRPLAAPTGILTPDTFWAGSPASECPAGHFRTADIPAEANPELVLDRLAVLRKSGGPEQSC